MKARLSDAIVRYLNQCMLFSLPSGRRGWGQALIAEQAIIASSRERIAWAAGGVFMSGRELIGSVFDNRPTWAAGLVLGIVAALLDLRSPTRRTYVFLLFAITLLLAYWQPKRAWRWPLLVTFVLPTIVLLTNDWGPYSIDRFDVFYGLVPAAVGALAGVALRGISNRLRRKPASR